ncbi:hypothetical protein CH352_09815 [Leptospira hartskeerlii]|uniref:Uncharacterized protein n=1 Tax=Leptospira hartskeerlii TaxID=2023177 RepID=A0A2M9XIG2_9LEPT|nr:hypothetical protein [Leptospira hartskeerlii]PJZ27362.1 hypothetical protein CH357_02080 [Leptospira hartskeerlii]PJZ34023.1 hypothetical protein CH352_09815 [Leptospira hartskeerlii]
MKHILLILIFFCAGIIQISASPLFFPTKLKIGHCLSQGGTSKELKEFYTSKLSPEERTKIAENLALQEAKSAYQSLECIRMSGLSKEEQTTLLVDHSHHRETKELMFSYYENFLLSDEKTIRLSAYEEKNLRSFLEAKKELLARLHQAEYQSLTEKLLPLSTFQNTYMALFFQHWEFYQTAPDFLREGLFD